jgi:predicted DNA-binding transcriptional regulator YafY
MTNKEIFTLESLDYLISASKTGTRQDLAKRFDVSERTISRLIEVMNSHGAEITFSRTKRSYVYKKQGNFIVQFAFREKL